MKKLLLIISLIVVSYSINAKPISDSLAKIVGLNFLNTKAVNPLGTIERGGLKLSYTAKGNSVSNSLLAQTQNYFYVFNIYGNKGFVIVAADANALPILGYSFNGGFDTTKLNSNVAYWLRGYEKQIQYIIENDVPQTEKIKTKWEELLNSSTNTNNNTNGNRARAQIGVQPQNGVATSVAPLLTTLWDQGPDFLTTGAYNLLCPYDQSTNTTTVTGCVATAMAQVMKYWNYPLKGSGFNSYTPNNASYGTLSENFGNITYDLTWSSLNPDNSTIKYSNGSIAWTNTTSTATTTSVASQNGEWDKRSRPNVFLLPCLFALIL